MHFCFCAFMVFLSLYFEHGSSVFYIFLLGQDGDRETLWNAEQGMLEDHSVGMAEGWDRQEGDLQVGWTACDVLHTCLPATSHLTPPPIALSLLPCLPACRTFTCLLLPSCHPSHYLYALPFTMPPSGQNISPPFLSLLSHLQPSLPTPWPSFLCACPPSLLSSPAFSAATPSCLPRADWFAPITCLLTQPLAPSCCPAPACHCPLPVLSSLWPASTPLPALAALRAPALPFGCRAPALSFLNPSEKGEAFLCGRQWAILSLNWRFKSLPTVFFSLSLLTLKHLFFGLEGKNHSLD